MGCSLSFFSPINKTRLALFGYSLVTGNYTAEASLSAQENKAIRMSEKDMRDKIKLE